MTHFESSIDLAASAMLALICLAACTSQTQSETSCVKSLDIQEFVEEALPDGRIRGVRGSWVPEEVPEAVASRLTEIPAYPSHVIMEFDIILEGDEVEKSRYRLCDLIEDQLNSACTSVHRNNRYLACTFSARDRSRIGYVEILPDDLKLSERTLIVVADEW